VAVCADACLDKAGVAVLSIGNLFVSADSMWVQTEFPRIRYRRNPSTTALDRPKKTNADRPDTAAEQIARPHGPQPKGRNRNVFGARNGTLRFLLGIAERVRLSLKAVLECWKDKISEN
jgi:hypothetical protein